MTHPRPIAALFALVFGLLCASAATAADTPAPTQAPFKYLWAKGYHVLPQTHNIDIGPEGKVYVVLAARNTTGFGEGDLNHVTRYDQATGRIEDLGVLAVKNPEFHAQAIAGPDGKPKPFTHGYQTLPDGTLTPRFQHLGAMGARDGSVYVLILYPYTLLRIPPQPTNTAFRLLRRPVEEDAGPSPSDVMTILDLY